MLAGLGNSSSAENLRKKGKADDCCWSDFKNFAGIGTRFTHPEIHVCKIIN